MLTSLCAANKRTPSGLRAFALTLPLPGTFHPNYLLTHTASCLSAFTLRHSLTTLPNVALYPSLPNNLFYVLTVLFTLDVVHPAQLFWSAFLSRMMAIGNLSNAQHRPLDLSRCSVNMQVTMEWGTAHDKEQRENHV